MWYCTKTKELIEPGDIVSNTVNTYLVINQDEVVHIKNNTRHVRMNHESWSKLFYIVEKNRKWKPVGKLLP